MNSLHKTSIRDNRILNKTSAGIDNRTVNLLSRTTPKVHTPGKATTALNSVVTTRKKSPNCILANNATVLSSPVVKKTGLNRSIARNCFFSQTASVVSHDTISNSINGTTANRMVSPSETQSDQRVKTVTNPIVTPASATRRHSARSAIKNVPTIIELESDFYHYILNKGQDSSKSQVNEGMTSNERILLDIELTAHKNRQASKKADEEKFNALKEQLLLNVERQVEQQICDLNNRVYQRFTIAPQLMEVINILSSQAASISRVKPLLLQQTDLMKTLITALNRLGFVKVSGKKLLSFSDADFCLGYLGIENLRCLIPFLIVQGALKDTSDKYEQASRRLWRHIQITAQAARVLAKQNKKLDADEVYMMALFHEMGSTLLLHLVEGSFSDLVPQFRQQVMHNRAWKMSSKMDKINSSIPVLEKIMPSRAAQLSAKLASRYKLNSLNLASTLEELATIDNINELSPAAKVIAQGRSYAIFKQMYPEKYLDKAKATALLNHYQLDIATLQQLNKEKYLTVPNIGN